MPRANSARAAKEQTRTKPPPIQRIVDRMFPLLPKRPFIQCQTDRAAGSGHRPPMINRRISLPHAPYQVLRHLYKNESGHNFSNNCIAYYGLPNCSTLEFPR